MTPRIRRPLMLSASLAFVFAVAAAAAAEAVVVEILPVERDTKVAVNPCDDVGAEIFAKYHAGVVRIESTGPDGPKAGAGVVLNRLGLVATADHIIRGATEASVVLRNGTRRPVLGLIARDAGQDLVLLKIDPGDADLSPLTLVQGPVDDRERVYALGAPGALSGTLANGKVRGTHPGPEISEMLPNGGEGHPFAQAHSVWVQSSAEMTSATCGGPLLRRDGRLVGIAAWRCAGREDGYFAIPAAKIAALAEGSRDKPVALKDVKWDDAGGAADCTGIVPSPAAFAHEWMPERRTKRVEATRAISSAIDGLRCVHCNGTGQIDVATLERLAPDCREVYEAKAAGHRRVGCPCCNKTGYDSTERTFTRIKHMLEAVMLLGGDADDKRIQQTRDAAAEVLRRAALDRTHNAEACNKLSAETLENPDQHRGEGVSVYGYVFEIADRGDHKLCLMIVYGTENQAVIASIPASSTPERGNYALVGGLCTGRATACMADGRVFRAPGIEALAIHTVHPAEKPRRR